MPLSALSLLHLAGMLLSAAAMLGVFRFVPDASTYDIAFTGLCVLALGAVAAEGAARRLERRLLLGRIAEEREAREAQALAIEALTGALEELRRHRDEGELVTEMRLVRSQLARITEGRRVTAPAGPLRLEGQPLIDAVHSALRENRIDLFLQPVVQLPQRRVAFQECLTRLRDAEGHSISPQQYMPVAEAAGLTNAVDNLSLFRCVQALKQRRRESGEAGFFCNLSSVTLDDSDFFDQFVEFLAANRDLSGHIVFELEADRFLDAGRRVSDNLDSLIRLGFRLSVDNIADNRFDLFQLARHNVSFAKVDVDALLHQPVGEPSLASYRERLKAKGLTLIAAKVETEKQVAELVEADVRLAQGYLFGEPRPMRGDG